jgi:hypothetical protein
MQEEVKQLPPAGGDPDDLMMEEVRPYLLDAREDYPEPFYMLEFNGVPFSAIGGIQAMSGQKKNGKTFVMAQLMAAILAPDSPRVHDNLPGLTVPQRTLEYLGHLPRVLYIDTEMEKLNSAKVLRRVHWLCNWPMNQPDERFSVLWMRTIEATAAEPAYAKRFRLIKMAIEVLHPDVVFIDGTRDIIGDFNDNAQSSALVQELMAIAEKKGICIWNVLHMNPRPGNDDESKMRGHLGTELGNKVTDTLVSIKKKQGSQVTFTVKQLDARSKDMEDWTFEVTDQAGSLGIPRIIYGGNNDAKSDKQPVTCDSPEQIRKWIHEASSRYEWPMDRKSIKKLVFDEIGGVKFKDKQQADLQAAINLKYLEESTMKKNGYYMLQPPDDLPF